MTMVSYVFCAWRLIVICDYSDTTILQICFPAVFFYRAACNANAVYWWEFCLSVCMSVYLSVCHTRVLWQNGRKICPDFYTIRKI